MIDIHSHILPAVDDGSQDIASSLEMLYMAYRDGVSDIVATPHGNREDFRNYKSDGVGAVYDSLKRALDASGIPIHLHFGTEIMASDDIARLILSGELASLCDSRYVLVEFPFDAPPYIITKCVYSVLSCGYVPVIAHPERYEATLREPECIYEAVMMGAATQINKSSLTGGFGESVRAASHMLIRHDLVSLAASDAHGISARTPVMSAARSLLSALTTSEYAELLFDENPRRLINDLPLLSAEPVPFR